MSQLMTKCRPSRVEEPGQTGWSQIEAQGHQSLANGPDLSIVFGSGHSLDLKVPNTWGSVHLVGQARYQVTPEDSAFLFSVQFGTVRPNSSFLRVTASINGHRQIFELNELYQVEAAATSLLFVVHTAPIGGAFRSEIVDGLATFHFDLLLEAYLSPKETSLIASIDAVDVSVI